MKKLNWTAILTYLLVMSVSTFVGWWLFKVLYFMYLLIKTYFTVC